MSSIEPAFFTLVFERSITERITGPGGNSLRFLLLLCSNEIYIYIYIKTIIVSRSGQRDLQDYYFSLSGVQIKFLKMLGLNYGFP